jgi:ribosomal protein S18 acetylase RimI-like enzyme
MSVSQQPGKQSQCFEYTRFLDARASDSLAIAELINMAGDGLPYRIWESYAPQDIGPVTFGADRVAAGIGNFSWRNVRLLHEQHGTTGMILAYRLPVSPPDFTDLHPLEFPLVKLESLVPGSFYINALAVYPAARGKGYGRLLMQQAHQLSDEAGYKQTSLIVFSENCQARKLYESLGYRVQASEPPLDAPDLRELGECLLMVRYT